VTFGDLRLSDVADDFVESVRRDVAAGAQDDADLLAWLEGPVMDALARGDEYSDAVPFKLQAPLAADSDGVLQPAELHFRGPLVAFFGPSGGSHLDQFAAMIVDNGLGYTIGMPTGGFSNTWEWTETLTLPGTGEPLVEFMWSIGQTIRPNGEVLEGNPAQVDEWYPRTAANHATYRAELLERAYAWLDGEPTAPTDGGDDVDVPSARPAENGTDTAHRPGHSSLDGCGCATGTSDLGVLVAVPGLVALVRRRSTRIQNRPSGVR
jgi:hypothetical protein